MVSGDLGSTVASLMHHAPILRHEHIAVSTSLESSIQSVRADASVVYVANLIELISPPFVYTSRVLYVELRSRKHQRLLLGWEPIVLLRCLV